MMIVSMDKKYTLDGKPYVILTTNKPGKCPVIGYAEDGEAMYFYLDGSNKSEYSLGHQLVEVSPYADFVIDEPVMVRDDDTDNWVPGYFAGVHSGKPHIWWHGATKWTRETKSMKWKQCRRPTKEELAK